jgi:RNA polymerase sigma factor (sigma-70 family)
MRFDINEWLEYKDMMVQIASEYTRKYPMVDVDDLQQEMYLWFVSHPKKYKEWQSLGERDKDKLIAKSLRNQCLKYCEKEKSRTVGYDLADLYYYDVSVIEAFLPSIIAESYEMPAKIKDLGNSIKSSEISDGINWLALRADIARAYYKLSDAKQNILRLRFSDPDMEWAKLADELGASSDAVRMKVQRALASIVQILGGWRPYHDEDTTKEQTAEAHDQQQAE